MIPLAPNWIISPKMGTIGKLVADHATRRLNVEIISDATADEMMQAEVGTVAGDYVSYELEGQKYRFSLARLRG